jgi:ADP-ribose pyrophosphatase
MDLKKILAMIRTGKIQDSKTICAVLSYVVMKKLY